MTGTAQKVLPEQRYLFDRRVGDIAAKVANSGGDDDLLSTTDLAQMSGTAPQFWELLRSKGAGPKFIRLSARRIRYVKRDVLTWLEERAHLRTSEYKTPKR